MNNPAGMCAQWKLNCLFWCNTKSLTAAVSSCAGLRCPRFKLRRLKGHRHHLHTSSRIWSIPKKLEAFLKPTLVKPPWLNPPTSEEFIHNGAVVKSLNERAILEQREQIRLQRSAAAFFGHPLAFSQFFHKCPHIPEGPIGWVSGPGFCGWFQLRPQRTQRPSHLRALHRCPLPSPVSL